MSRPQSKAKLGIITIGQSPRVDVLPDFIGALGYKPHIEQRGLLDELTEKAIVSLAPVNVLDETLVTRLRDGTEVKLSEKRVIEMLPQAVAYLEGKDVDLIVLFCTGEFPPITSRVLILYPSVIVGSVVSALFSSTKSRDRKLCVVAPAKEQHDMLAKKWRCAGVALAFETLSPYTSGSAEIAQCAERAAKLQCDMIVLDCIGYTEKIRSVFASVSHVPVILPRALLARVTAELLAR